MKNFKYHGQKTNSAGRTAVKAQIPLLGSKFRGPRKTVGNGHLT